MSFFSSSSVLDSGPSRSSFTAFSDSRKIGETVWKIVTGRQSQQQMIAAIDALQKSAGDEVLDPFSICLQHDISLLQYAVNGEMEELVAYFLQPPEHFSYAQVDAYLAVRAEMIDSCECAGLNTALHLACRGKQSRIVALLIEAGASIDCKNCRNETPLYISACIGDIESLSLIAKRAGGDKDYLNAGGNRLKMSALHQVSFRGDVRSVLALLEAGAGVSVQHLEGATPLHFAAEQGMTEVAEILIGHADSPTAFIECKELLQDRTALHLASMQGHCKCARQLIQLGAPIDAKDRSGLTPLHYAAEQGKSDLVWMLIQEGADFSIPFFEETFLDILAKNPGALDRFLHISNFWLKNIEEIGDLVHLTDTLKLQDRLVQYIAKKLYADLPRAVKQIATATLVLPMTAALTGAHLKNSFSKELEPVLQELRSVADHPERDEDLLRILTDHQEILATLQKIARSYLSESPELTWMAELHSTLEMTLLELTMRRLHVYAPGSAPSNSGQSSAQSIPSSSQKSKLKRAQRPPEKGPSQVHVKRASVRNETKEGPSASLKPVAIAKRTEISKSQHPTCSSSDARELKRYRSLRTDAGPIDQSEAFDLSMFGISPPY